MNLRLKKSFQWLFFLALGIGLAWWSVRDLTEQQMADMAHSFSKLKVGYIVLSFVLGIAAHWLRALRWNMLLEAAGQRTDIISLFLSVLSGYLANLAFPRLGEVTRCGLLDRYRGVPFATSLGTVVLERIVDVLTLGLVIVLVLLTQFTLYYGFFYNKILMPTLDALIRNQSFLGIVLIGTLFLLFVLIFYRKALINKFLKGFFGKLLSRFAAGFRSLAYVKSPVRFILLSLGIWCCYWLVCLLVFQSFSGTESLPSFGMGPGLAMLVSGAFAMMLTQGGIGAYPVAAAQTLVLYGISYPIGLTCGWILWLNQTLLVLATGSLAIALFPTLRRS